MDSFCIFLSCTALHITKTNFRTVWVLGGLLLFHKLLSFKDFWWTLLRTIKSIFNSNGQVLSTTLLLLYWTTQGTNPPQWKNTPNTHFKNYKCYYCLLINKAIWDSSCSDHEGGRWGWGNTDLGVILGQLSILLSTTGPHTWREESRGHHTLRGSRKETPGAQPGKFPSGPCPLHSPLQPEQGCKPQSGPITSYWSPELRSRGHLILSSWILPSLGLDSEPVLWATLQ